MKYSNDLDLQLKQLDQTFKLQDQDKNDILTQINEQIDQPSHQLKKNWKALALTAASVVLCIILVPLFIQNMNDDASKESILLPEDITYYSIKTDLTIGMTKEEILETLNVDEPSKIIEDPRGFVTFRFDQGVKDGYTINEDYVDTYGLINDYIKMQVFVRFDESDQAKYISALEYNDEQLYHYHLSEKDSNYPAYAFNKEVIISDTFGPPQFLHIEDYIYEVPSLSFIASYDGTFDKEQFIRFKDFESQQMDEVKETLVNQMYRNYRAGDTILLEEIIQQMEYNAEENVTYFEIGSDEYSEHIVFAEDLTNQFNVGDPIKLKFLVIPMSADGLYTDMYYNVEDHSKIEDFLVE